MKEIVIGVSIVLISGLIAFSSSAYTVIKTQSVDLKAEVNRYKSASAILVDVEFSPNPICTKDLHIASEFLLISSVSAV